MNNNVTNVNNLNNVHTPNMNNNVTNLNTVNKTNILFWNIRCFASNETVLKDFCNSNAIDAVALCETWSEHDINLFGDSVENKAIKRPDMPRAACGEYIGSRLPMYNKKQGPNWVRCKINDFFLFNIYPNGKFLNVESINNV
jgi:hypothetical protein